MRALMACLVFGLGGMRVEGMPALSRLGPGEVMPKGWMRDWCEAARDGCLLRLNERDAEFKRAWSVDYTPTGTRLNWPFVKNPQTGEDEPGFWSAEGGAYWFYGIVLMSAQLDDRSLTELAHKRIDPLVAKMHPDALSFLWWLNRNNPVDYASIAESKLGDRAWAFHACGILARALCEYYRVTHDPQVLRALEIGLNDERILSLYGAPVSAACDACRLGVGKSVAQALDKVRDMWVSGDFYYALGPRARGAKVPTRLNRLWCWEPQGHGVLAHESLLAVLRMYEYCHDPSYLDSVREWVSFIDSFAMQPTGVPVCDEGFGLMGGDRGTETCAVFLSNYLRSELFLVTGEGKWCDDVERGFFNASAACVSRDFRSHCYIQAPDMITKELPKDRLVFSSGGENVRCRMETKHYPLCCTASLCRNLSGFISASWLRMQGDGLVAALWMPCEVKTQVRGMPVGISVKTDYPFGEDIELVVNLEGPVEFPLSLHIPDWCAEAKLSVNGADVACNAEMGFIKLVRVWRDGDRVCLSLPMRPRLEMGVDRNSPTEKGWASVVCGPLVYSLGFPEKDENTGADPAFPYDYALDPSTALVGSKLERRPMPAKWSWQLDAPVSVTVRARTGETLALVPYGCTRLRKTMFACDAVK